nr:PASTA domain-containing protein [Olsenella profusa]
MVSIPSPVESLPERKRRLPRWAVVLLVLALVAAAAGVAWYTYDQELWGGRTVPSVVGMSEQEATDALEALGFAVTVDYQPGDDDFGTVLSCSPEPGVRADTSAGATITVAAERVIPEVVGKDVESAESALRDAGAYNIEITYRNSSEAEGTVVEVSPAAGEPFVSSDTVTLTVAQPFTVPNVEGMSVQDAQALLDSEGLASSVTYVESDAEKNTVVGVSPGVGERVDAGSTVELSVSTPYPSEPWDLLAYFDATPQEISAYLADEGFSPTHASIYASGGHADAAYADADGDVLKVSDTPESASYGAESTTDVLAEGAGIGGVRYVFSSASVPEGGTAESEAGVRAVMAACGLDGLIDTCTQDSIEMPQERPEDMPHFICGYGRQEDYTWAVIIGGYEGSTKVVALAAPTEHFSGIGLSGYGGRVCDYVAATDLFTE